MTGNTLSSPQDSDLYGEEDRTAANSLKTPKDSLGNKESSTKPASSFPTRIG